MTEKLSDSEELEQEARVKMTPSMDTAVDALGVERIVQHDQAPYEPPQVEADPHEVHRLEQLQKKLDKRNKERHEARHGDGATKVAKEALKADTVGSPKPVVAGK